MSETVEIIQDDIRIDYNAIKTISVNGTEQTITDKNVNIDVPTKVSDLDNDREFLTEETDPTVPQHVKNITEQNITNWNNKSDFSGNYSDLTNKPSIPVALSDLTEDTAHRLVTDTEKSTWTAKYDKPANGIPSTDLDSAVQASLGKADTALQTHQDITDKEDKANKVITISSSSTNIEYPSALAVYNLFNSIVNGNEVEY